MSDLITSQMLSDWRANYGLDKRTPIKAMHWWQDNMDGKAPAGVVAALGLCINEIERLTAALRAQPGPVSMDDVEWAGKAHLAEAIRERDELRDVLLRNGFVPCDIPACNCGSWHHRYGLPERMQEIKDALAEAGQELSNANGHLPINALKALVAERDELRRQLAEAEPRARRYQFIRDADRSDAFMPIESILCYSMDSLDAAIDAAIGASNE